MYLVLRNILSKAILFVVLPMAIYSFQRFAPAPIGNTLIWWIIQTAILMIFLAAFIHVAPKVINTAKIQDWAWRYASKSLKPLMVR